MKFILNLSADNDAFYADDVGEPRYAPERELARILRVIADDIYNYGKPFDQFQTIFDVNGNDVGRYALKQDDYK